jgi:hypothetical protein
MNKALAISTLLFVATIFGCADSSSGVDRSTKLSQATAAEKMQFCEWQTEQSGGARTVQCDANSSVTVKSVEACISTWPTTSSCTIGVMEDCYVSVDGNPCNFGASLACSAALQCLLTQ